MFLFAINIMVGNGTHLGTDVAWKEQKCQAPWEKIQV